MKLELVLTKAEIMAKYAAELGVDEKSLSLRIEGDDAPEAPAKEPERFLRSLIRSKGFTEDEAAQICGVAASTVNRACNGYNIQTPTYLKIVRGLDMTEDEAKEFKKSLTRHQ